jgi:phosphonate transport system substrate-binding protein
MYQRRKLIGFSGICVLLILPVLSVMASLSAGCSRQKESAPVRRAFGQQELLIGLIPEQNIFRQRERYNMLRKYLSERLGITVNFTSLSRYGNIIDRFSAERMDGAFFGSFTYGLAHQQLGVEPIARPVNLDGTSTYHGYIFVRKDSGIRTLSDMKGKRFAFVEHATTAGYLFPLAYFRANGIADPQQYLGTSFFAGSHDAAILAVLNREADIGAAKNTIYDQLAGENARIEQELITLATSGVVPQNCLAVRKDLDPDLKEELKKVLLNMETDPEGAEILRKFGARGFVETADRDYAYLYTLTTQVGIDLKTYSYKNK